MALAQYGEYSEGEVVVFRKVLRPGDVAIDVGANIGAFTVPMAKLVSPGELFGATGKVYAIEASKPNVALLKQNVEQNGLQETVTVLPFAASDRAGTIKITNQDALHAYSRLDINTTDFSVRAMTIDSLNLTRCRLIKIDVDRHELQVLRGAKETILRCRPTLYFENEHDDLREELVAFCIDELNYRLFWHKPFQFHIDNWKGNKRNLFANIVSMMNIGVPNEQGWEVKDLEEVSDLRQDDRMFDREIERYQNLVEQNPDDLTSQLMVGHYQRLMRRIPEADTALQETLRRDPEHKPAQAIKGLWLLQDGKWKEGWRYFELRYGQKNRHMFGGDRLDWLKCPQWDGQPTDKPLLIWSEQGFGDAIMFSRFFRFVRERAPNAFLEVNADLHELFEFSSLGMVHSNSTTWWEPSADRIPEAWFDRVYILGRTLPAYELHCSLPSTPAMLQVDENMMRVNGPYLFADPMLTRNWRGKGNYRMGQTPDPMCGARIGLCLRGSAFSERWYTRDCPEHIVAPMARRFGPFFPLKRYENVGGMMATAAAISTLDLVITVDTSIAHLAGALGIETWLLLAWDPDFRWGLSGDRTIWYPNIRIFRQPKFRDWQSVIDDVSVELAKREAQNEEEGIGSAIAQARASGGSW
jgi:FkbM family methyltransferase